ncbi:MAG TPA: circularly permuted type 2 ATP-grasp protein [Verrucomicrobiae bacterium]|jgi:uncharacterized circularly permuted ATP-grasp superfamily protein/uncharacterized alpha-E superfamily protein|nr:circularly permuted type 2 ATP-grasp protein [Verrucomicrobiae bacterium]
MNLADATPTNAPLVASYRPAAGAYDEMLGEDRSLRPQWQKLVGALEKLSPHDLSARRDTAFRVLRDHGVTYNVYHDGQGQDRPWALDLMPLIIPPEEWPGIEAGLTQRTRLFNAILADIYGPQTLLRDGALPPALLYANPAFLRPCHGIAPARNLFLFFHGVDLGRSPDGQWWVLSDRTQAPSGAGYTLQNRMVLSHVMPDEFRDCRVERLAGFFEIARNTLRSLAPRPSGQPSVVLLTPGPYNETYFEHVYLARYLGFPLVQGADLTVRDRRVFLKTLEGLQQVDVILRRADDTFCDPLELRADSFLGTPGLLDAARAGNVAIANALGAGVVETPALTSFLPGICRRLLGEELKLPSVATWWCGQPHGEKFVQENIHRLVVRRAFSRGDVRFGGAMTERERAYLRAEMASAPFDFVGQEVLPLSAAPALEGSRLAPRRVVLRAYVCATSDGFTVMPGGLTRFSGGPDDLVVSMQHGGSSKDTWVTTSGPVSQLTLLLPNTEIVRLERSAVEVPSRVADNLFWLGRYTERLEDTVRLLRSVLSRLAEVGAEETPDLTALVRLLAHLDLFPPKFRDRHTLAAVEREVYALIYQPHRLGAVREVRERLSSIAFALRDRFSADSWRIVSKLQDDTRPRPGRIPISEGLELLNTLIFDLAAFAGMEMENMTRGHGWRFLDIGRRLERATNMTTLVEGALTVEAGGWSALEPVLEIADSVMTYRRRYFAQPQWPTALDLLLADETNPRSLAFQICALSDHVANLPRETGGASARETQQAQTLRALLSKADFPSMVAGQMAGRGAELSEFLARIVTELRVLSDSINQQYFSHAAAQAS